MAALDDIASQLARLTDKVDALPHAAARAVWGYESKGRSMDFYQRVAVKGVAVDSEGKEVPVPIVLPPLDAPTGGAL